MSQTQSLLPDLFLAKTGTRVARVDEWRLRRDELRDDLLRTEYGDFPSAPTHVYGGILHVEAIPEPSGADHTQLRVHIEGGVQPFHFLLQVRTPHGDGPFPVVLRGDDCWGPVAADIQSEVLTRGYILATFDRTEIVPDAPCPERDSALYAVYPDADFAALAAWAWGYHRCIDVLTTLPKVNAGQIAVVGHSRGGKASLLAGAMDERIAVTCANNSGCGGAGSFSIQGEGCEKRENITRAFPHWFSPNLNDFRGRDDQLPFDQHAVKALVAPRGLLTTEALGDLWANPSGTYQTYLAAREVYRFLGAEENIRIWYREGGHNHRLADWKALLDFTDHHFRGTPLSDAFGTNPYPEMPEAFDWSAPLTP